MLTDCILYRVEREIGTSKNNLNKADNCLLITNMFKKML